MSDTMFNNCKTWIVPFLLLLILLFVSPYHDTWEEWDGVMQYFAGQEIISGQGYTGWASLFWPPGYPIILGVLSPFISGFVAGKGISIICAIVFIWLVYEFSMHITQDTNIAIASQVFTITISLFFLSSIMAQSHMLSATLFFASIVAFLKAEEKQDRNWFFLTGLLIGLAGLIRYENYILILAMGIYLLFKAKDNWKKLIYLLIGFILISSPWWIYNTIENGSPIYNAQYLNVGNGIYETKGMNTDEWWWNDCAEYDSLNTLILNNPLDFLHNMAINLISIVSIILSISFVLLFGLCEVAKNRSKYLFLILCFILFCLFVSIAFIVPRLFLGWIGIIAVLTIKFVKETSKNYFIPTFLLILCIMAVLTYLEVSDYLKYDDIDSAQLSKYREIVELLKTDPNIKDKYVVSTHPAFAYYSGSKYAMLPQYFEGDFRDLENYNFPEEIIKANPSYPSNERIIADYVIFQKITDITPNTEYMNENTTNFIIIYETDLVLVLKKT